MSGRILSSPLPLHVSLGQQRLLSPPAVQRKAVLGSRSGDIRHTCPSHLHLRLLICMAREIASVLWCSSSLVMMLSQNTPRIFRRDLFWKVSSFFASLPISFQHSENYTLVQSQFCFQSQLLGFGLPFRF